MNFQINDETYFLSLSENERSWLLFVSSPNGPREIPVYVDAPESEELRVVVADGKTRETVN